MTARHTHLIFDTALGGTKPMTLLDNELSCPFCCRDQLTGIIAEDGPIILLSNKYPVLEDTCQTVLIETDDCNSELSLYPRRHLHKVIRFGIDKWQEMIASREFASVLFFKNHGPYSGGTIRHPHMQIVGLRNVDYTVNIPPASLEGRLISRRHGVELTLADRPLIGFAEFNVRLTNLEHIDTLADYLQIAAHYVLNHYNKRCNSYNIFFYQLDGQITAKLMPRFVTSPLYVGYVIPQISSRLDEIAEDIRRIYNL